MIESLINPIPFLCMVRPVKLEPPTTVPKTDAKTDALPAAIYPDYLLATNQSLCSSFVLPSS